MNTGVSETLSSQILPQSTTSVSKNSSNSIPSAPVVAVPVSVPVIVSEKSVVVEKEENNSVDSRKEKEKEPLTFSDLLHPSVFIDRFMDIKSINPVAKSFLVGSISGTCSTVLFQPLDLLKTRIQAPMIGPGTNSGAGLFTIAGHIVRDEKFTGLWRGMVPKILLEEAMLPISQTMLAGGVEGLNPEHVELLVREILVVPNEGNDFIECCYTSLDPSLVSLTRCVPGVGLYFASLHGMKIFFKIEGDPTALQSGFLGVTGRIISGVTMIPFTVVKTRYESKMYKYTSIREALQMIYKGEGIRGLTCGLLPTLLRDAPFSGLYFMMYTSTKQIVPKDWMDSSTLAPYARFSCGIIAGCGASLVTQPADVIKTKMQLFPNKFHSIPPVIAYVYQKYGVKGYFKGLMPRMVRRTLVAAMSWTVYEQLMYNIGLK